MKRAGLAMHTAGETRSSMLSDCGAYEYEFRLTWEPSLPPVLFVMLNPSMDDYEKGRDGRTTERCKSFARAWGRGGVVFANVFALRSTSPEGLLVADDPIGPENDAVLRRLVS